MIRRILYLIPLFFGISILSFSVMYAAGNPVDLITLGNPKIAAQTKEVLKQYYGLDKPIYYQYFLWLWRFIHLDLGTSFYRGRPVNAMIGVWVWETAKLQLAALLLALAIAIPVGIISAKKQYSKADMIVTTSALFGISIPIFYLGVLFIIIFSYYLGLFPSFGAHSIYPSSYPLGSYILDEIWHMVLPTMAIAYVEIALYVRLVRSSMLEVLRQDYVLAARASGLSERTVIYKHALRNAIIPVVTFIGLTLGMILAGAPMTEYVFSWPGLGYLYWDAVNKLDFPVIQGINMIITVMILVANLLTDMAYAAIDPRIRLE